MKRRVVVTGFGLVTPCGNDVASTWAAMLSGESGVGFINKFDTERYSVKIAAEVKNLTRFHFLKKKKPGVWARLPILLSRPPMRR